MRMNILHGMVFPRVVFVAEGGNIRSFLSNCLEKNIHLADVRAIGYGISAQVRAKDYRRLHIPARRAGCKLQTVRKYGLWFRLRGLSRHKGAGVGVLMALTFLMLTQPLVWNIEYYGVAPSEQQYLGDILFTNGVYQGCIATNDKLRHAETAALTRLQDYADLSLNYAKGKLIVEAEPAAGVPKMLLPQDHDIVANETGVIRRVEVFAGTSDLKPGQLVQKGDVLVRSVWQDQENKLQPSPCRARIMAYIEKTCATAQKIRQEQNIVDKTAVDSLALCIGDRRIWLKKGKDQEAVPSCRGVEVFGLALPVTVFKTLRTETIAEEYRMTEEQAKSKCVETLNALLYAEHPEMEVLSREYRFETVDDTVFCTLELRAYVDIAAANAA